MKRTGVIVGVAGSLTPKDVEWMSDQLREVFPGVKFAVVSGAASVAFEYEDGLTSSAPPEPPPRPNRPEEIRWGQS